MSTAPIRDGDAFWRLHSRRAVTPNHRFHNSFQAFRVLAFCAVWQRSGGTVEGVVASGYCGRRTAFSRLASCHGAGFEPELVTWGYRQGDEWEDLEANTVRHMQDDFARELAEFNRRPLITRLLRMKPKPHPDQLEDTSE